MVMGDPLPLWLSCLSVVPVAAASVATGGRRSTTPARALPGVLQHDALVQQLLAYGVGPVELPALLGLLSLLDQGLDRSEEHTSELQSRGHLVCRLLLEKKNQKSP